MQALITHRPYSKGKNTNGNSSSRSWGEDLQKYQTHRSQLPWKDSERKPVKHITRYEKSREEREYDPILGKLRDLQKETLRSAQSARNRKNSLTLAMNKQQRMMQKFNLINHRPFGAIAADKSSENQSGARPSNTRVGYDLISNMDLPTGRRPQTQASFRGTGRAVKQELTHPREFNILTNKYLEKHDDHAEQDHEAAKARAEEKFWKTHDYNPLVGTFYDTEKEETFVKAREEKRKTHGLDRVEKLPDSEQFSEGRAVNIISKQVIDDKRFTRLTNKQNRSINSKNATQIEQRLRTEAETRAEVIDQRSLNRISYVRQIEPYKKGYDILTMQPYVGRTRKVIAPIKQKPKPPKWERLKVQSEIYRVDNSFRDLSGKKQEAADVLVIRRGENLHDAAGTEYQKMAVERPRTVNTVSLERESVQVPGLNLVDQVRTGGF